MSESAELEPWQQRASKQHWTNVAIKRLMDDINANPISDLILSEGTVYGSRYFCVEPIGGSWFDMETWCLDTFGDTGSIWQETKSLTPEPHKRWYANNRKFWFRNEKDRNWFIVRWSK
jgi:hypothetical protein